MLSFLRRDVAKAAWLRSEAAKILANTPDAATLSRYEYQLLFVYDQMKNGLYEAERIGPECMFCATAYTNAKFEHWKKNLGFHSESFALMVDPSMPERYQGWRKIDHNNVPVGRVQGELYLVHKSKIFELDKHKQNVVAYQRRRVHLLVPYRDLRWVKDRSSISEILGVNVPSVILDEQRICEVRAWMYVANPKYWGPMLDAGYLFSPVNAYMPSKTGLGLYSTFTRKEYEQSSSSEAAVSRM